MRVDTRAQLTTMMRSMQTAPVSISEYCDINR
jgi:hypothetical protein